MLIDSNKLKAWEKKYRTRKYEDWQNTSKSKKNKWATLNLRD